MTVQSGRHQATHAAGGREASRGRAGESAAGAAAAPAFVGRDDAFARVAEALDHGPALVLIEGEAGIGKTRLLQEVLAARTRQRGSTGSALQKDSARGQDGAARPDSPTRQESIVLVAACPPLQEPFPLGPVVDGLRRLGDDIGSVELSPLGGALRPLIPEWAGQLPPALEPIDDPKETRHRLFRALAELIDRIGVEVLVVEDGHWADTSTMELLLTLTAAGDHRMSVVVTYRPTDVPDGSLLLRLTAHPPVGMNCVRITLEPLGVTETRQMVGSMFGTDEVSDKFAAFLYDRTDGVPLAVEECVRLLRDRHDIVKHEGRWTRRLLDELEVPPTVRDSVLERVTRLDPAARTVLEAAAVLAAPADERLLTNVADLDDKAGRTGVAAALASGLLRESDPGRYVFRHVLDAQAVEKVIPVSQWRRLHRLAAESLQGGAPKPVVQLARHFREAGDIEAWCYYAEASADLALEAGDDRTAVITLLELVNTANHPVAVEARLARKLGDAVHSGASRPGDLTAPVIGVLRSVLSNGELGQDERGELRLLLGRVLWTGGQGLAAFKEFEAAIPDLGRRPALAIRAMLNLALPFVPSWPAARHLRWLERAAGLVDKAGSSSDRLAFRQMRSTTLLLLGEEAGWESVDLQETEAVSGQREQRSMAVRSLNIAKAMLLWGRYDDTRRQLNAVVKVSESTGFERLAESAQVVGARLAWCTGVWQGLRDSLSGLVASEETYLPDRLQARQILGLVDLATGARAAAEQHLRMAMDEQSRRVEVEPDAVLAPAALARLLLSDGAADGALTMTEPGLEMVKRKGVWLWAADIAPVHVQALVSAERTDEVEALVDQFAAGLAGRNAPAAAAALSVCEGLLVQAQGDVVRAAALFAEAAEKWSAMPRPYEELLALEHHGRSLLAADERDQALSLLNDVQGRLFELGARWDADRVARLLRQHGVEVSRAWKRGPRGYGGQLSPREKEVLALVARGMTNREVGQVLFLSPKTVGVHLSAAMRKLAVTSRTAAAMAAADAGLISSDHDGQQN